MTNTLNWKCTHYLQWLIYLWVRRQLDCSCQWFNFTAVLLGTLTSLSVNHLAVTQLAVSTLTGSGSFLHVSFPNYNKYCSMCVQVLIVTVCNVLCLMHFNLACVPATEYFLIRLIFGSNVPYTVWTVTTLHLEWSSLIFCGEMLIFCLWRGSIITNSSSLHFYVLFLRNPGSKQMNHILSVWYSSVSIWEHM